MGSYPLFTSRTFNPLGPSTGHYTLLLPGGQPVFKESHRLFPISAWLVDWDDGTGYEGFRGYSGCSGSCAESLLPCAKFTEEFFSQILHRYNAGRPFSAKVTASCDKNDSLIFLLHKTYGF